AVGYVFLLQFCSFLGASAHLALCSSTCATRLPCALAHAWLFCGKGLGVGLLVALCVGPQMQFLIGSGCCFSSWSWYGCFLAQPALCCSSSLCSSRLI
ncbi:hypothetical protein U1Q18_040056, partial [Sarracenia purpurea var. burkii]